MNRSIGGRLGARELLTLSGDTEEGRMRAFHLMSRVDQATAIHRLHNAGYSDHGISSATRLSVEFIRHVLGQHQEVRA